MLLDGAVLIARSDVDHPHHRAASKWLAENPEFAVCPITEGALVRYLYRNLGYGASQAQEILLQLEKTQGYRFWPDDISYRSVGLSQITGHQQITDAYLVALAEHHGGRLVTFDQALVRVHPEAFLIPFI